MTTFDSSRPASPPFQFALNGVIAPFAIAFAALGSAAVIFTMQLWALVLPAYIGTALLAVFFPRVAAPAFLAILIAFEPGQLGEASDVIYRLPPGWENALGLTIAPIEAAIVILAVSLWVRPRTVTGGARLPLLAYGSVAALAFGMVYGLHKGGDDTLAYHEARGFVYGLFVFAIVTRLGPSVARSALPTVLLASGALAVMALLRYFLVVRQGDVPVERAFSHETPLLIMIGIVIAIGLLIRGQPPGRKIALILYAVVLAGAILATGRRAGTLVLLAGLASCALLAFPHKRMLVSFATIIFLIGSSIYLAAYWNKEYGALAQPARAVRSQIDPSGRDKSSDTYREFERLNVEQTIRLNRVLGLGFGRPFGQFIPVPDLTSFWPLQHYTPHQNILWLWLKLGIGGCAVLLAFVTLALRRAFTAGFTLPPKDPRWLMAAVIGPVIVMYLAYGSVDLAFVSTRSMAPLAVALALAVCVNFERKKEEGPR